MGGEVAAATPVLAPGSRGSPSSTGTIMKTFNSKSSERLCVSYPHEMKMLVIPQKDDLSEDLITN